MVATTIISHIPPSTNTYIGSPSIVALNPLHLIATHDYFGSGTTAHVSGQTEVYESYDGGKSWNHMASITDTFWSSLFLHNNHLYLLGTTKEHGALVIRQSSNGKNWTPPHLIRSGQWHTAPVPVVTWHGHMA